MGKMTPFIEGNMKTGHTQFVTNTTVCPLTLNNYSIYKFLKALVPPKEHK